MGASLLLLLLLPSPPLLLLQPPNNNKHYCHTLTCAHLLHNTPGGAAARRLTLLLGLRLANRALRLLEEDEEGDLFYESGRATQELVAALV